MTKLSQASRTFRPGGRSRKDPVPALLMATALFALPAQLSAQDQSGSTPTPPAPSQSADRELTDRVLMLTIENELLSSPAVDSHRIDVAVEEGIVTLSGSVNNLLASEIAIGLARRTRGTLSVVDQIEVNPVERNDDDLQKDLQAALAADPGTQKLKLTISVSRGHATLTGEVPTHGALILAGRVVSAVAGIRELTNALRAAAPKEVSDVDLQKEIGELLRFEVLLDNARLEVEVKNGEAVLHGVVSNASQRFRAAQLASLAGARKVDTGGLRIDWRKSGNHLRDERYEDATDPQIAAALVRALKHDPRVLSFEPKVHVKDGLVTLTGSVDYLAAKIAAERVARYTIGVRRVKNHLHVRAADEPPSDAEIVRFTREALRRDPYLNHENIVISCENAHTGLYGVVDNEFEREHAVWTASRQRGVVHVENHLNLRNKWKPKADAAIAADLREKLSFILMDPDNKLAVEVTNGVAILDGTVDTWYMWQIALDQALAAGAREPRMMVDVRYAVPEGARYYGPYYYIPR